MPKRDASRRRDVQAQALRAANAWLVSRLVLSWYGEHPMLALTFAAVALGALGLLACTAFVPLRLPWSRNGDQGASSTCLDEARAQL